MVAVVVLALVATPAPSTHILYLDKLSLVPAGDQDHPQSRAMGTWKLVVASLSIAHGR